MLAQKHNGGFTDSIKLKKVDLKEILKTKFSQSIKLTKSKTSFLNIKT